MNIGFFASLALVLAVVFLAAPAGAATDAGTASARTISLPAPDKQGGMPLMQALAGRKSTRQFKDTPLALQDMSNLLWAAFGVNRENGRRTAPTARNTQEVAVYAAMGSGVWRYDGAKHELVRELERDTRAAFGGAPLTLVYAAKEGPFAGMHLGSMYQNAGLYCASAGLGNVVKATGADVLQKDLKLPAGYKILIVQSIGYPK